MNKTDNNRKKININDYKLKQQRKFQKNNNNDDDNDNDQYGDEVEYKKRSAFTPGWTNNISTKPALPIKEGNKIIKIHKEVKEEEDSEEDDDEDEFERNNNKDDESLKNKKLKNVDVEKNNKYQKMSYERIKIKIADICTTATADPEQCLKRVSNNNNDTNESSSRFIDMFDILKNNNLDVVGLAMISILLVFKNIIPSYKIVKQDVDSEVMLKKETKKLRDYETMLLQHYQRYLKFLEETVYSGLGSSKKKIADDKMTTPVIALGFKALKCQCELLKAASHFNYRSMLLSSVVTRALQPDSNINVQCCDTLIYLFKNDLTCDLSYEIVQIVSKGLTATNYDVPEQFLRILEHVKMTVRADDASEIRKKAKQERKKRKRSGDDIDIAMLESSATGDKLSMKRFQVTIIIIQSINIVITNIDLIRLNA